MEKKTYIAPQMEILDIESMEMIATSAPHIGIVDPDDPNGGSGTEILSNRRRGKWGNLWHEE